MSLENEVPRSDWRDPNELAALVMRYQNRLYRYLLRLVGKPAVAEDIFQQTWLRVIEKHGRYDPRRSFEPWLFTVARNLAMDHLRRREPESLDEPLPSELPPHEQLLATDPSALEGLLDHERSSILAAALAELPAIYREVLTLRFEEEMKLEQIAEVLNTPLPTVKSRLRRALHNLRGKLHLEPAG